MRKFYYTFVLFATVLRPKIPKEAFSSKLLPFAQFTTHTLLNKIENGKKKFTYPYVRATKCLRGVI